VIPRWQSPLTPRPVRRVMPRFWVVLEKVWVLERWTERTEGVDMVGDQVWVIFDIEQNIRSGAWGIGKTYRFKV